MKRLLLIVAIAGIILSVLGMTIYKDSSTNEEKIKRYVATDNRNCYYLDREIDLRGDSLFLPHGAVIVPRGGILKNGVVIGNSSKIEDVDVMFDNVRITGSWEVPFISTSMFKDLSYNNALRDVVALSSPICYNTIIIEKGHYYFNLNQEAEAGITLSDNTDLIVNGTLSLSPNSLSRCYIIHVAGANIRIYGEGMIEGDRSAHRGKDGQWGMGINFHHSENCLLKGLTIKDCWGDCVYVGKGSKNIIVSDCNLYNSRRQGISVTSCNTISILDCNISDIHGTAPEYGIDIEPNSNETVENVTISGISVTNSVGGILAYGKAKNAKVRNVNITGCRISKCSSSFPFRLEKVYNVVLLDNLIECERRTRVMLDSVFNLQFIKYEDQIRANRPDAIKSTNSIVHFVK